MKKKMRLFAEEYKKSGFHSETILIEELKSFYYD